MDILELQKQCIKAIENVIIENYYNDYEYMDILEDEISIHLYDGRSIGIAININ